MTNMPPVQTPTLKSHQRQRFWQILLPIILVVLLAIVAAVFSTLSETEHIERWAEISTIWLVVPLMLFALLCMAVLGGMIYAVARLMKITPRYTLQAQNFVFRFTAGVRRAADITVQPVMWIKQAGAVLASLTKPPSDKK